MQPPGEVLSPFSIAANTTPDLPHRNPTRSRSKRVTFSSSPHFRPRVCLGPPLETTLASSRIAQIGGLISPLLSPTPQPLLPSHSPFLLSTDKQTAKPHRRLLQVNNTAPVEATASANPSIISDTISFGRSS
ncbi:hypothetical protein HAX54_050381 [Datura stramonium]|uniref:Uncharacterized protein n=1 Tax=Datura stramonium TaxID=4076 RepID=A0ABS8WNH4_DATST|nr:hypothetical protein [Datura stramonium]